MVRQSVIYLIISILVVVFSAYIHTLIVYIDTFYTWVNLKLAPIFSASQTGILIRDAVSLVVIPIVIVGTPALIYRLIKKQAMPYFLPITWLVWLTIVLSKVLIQ